MRTGDGFTKFGKFSIAPERQINGELRVAGKESSLYLRDDEFFNTHSLPSGHLTGILFDLTKVTLIQCLTREGPGSGSLDGEQYHYAKMFPQFVLEGRRHLDQTIGPSLRSRFERVETGQNLLLIVKDVGQNIS